MPFGVDDAIAVIGALGGIFGHKNKPNAQQQQASRLQNQAGQQYLDIARQLMQRGALPPNLGTDLGNVRSRLQERAGIGPQGPYAPDRIAKGQIASQDADLSAYLSRQAPGIAAAGYNGQFTRGNNINNLSEDLAARRVQGIRDIIGQQDAREGANLGQFENFTTGQQGMANNALGQALGATGGLAGLAGAQYAQGANQQATDAAAYQNRVAQIGGAIAQILEHTGVLSGGDAGGGVAGALAGSTAGGGVASDQSYRYAPGTPAPAMGQDYLVQLFRNALLNGNRGARGAAF